MRNVVLFGLAGGILIALLRLIEYHYLVRAYPGEVYGGLVAALFAALGLWLGRRSRSRRIETEMAPPGPFVDSSGRAKQLGITPREQEILALIAAGLSNRQIGEKLFVSESTVKTHVSRLFDKIGASRRTEAVQRAKELGLLQWR